MKHSLNLFRFSFLAIITLISISLFPLPATAKQTLRAESLPVLGAFEQRLKSCDKRLPRVIRAAEAAAKRIVKNPKALISVPYGEQQLSFSEDIMNRAGGLAITFPPCERPEMLTPKDIVLFSVRSWEKNGEDAKKYLQEYHDKGWMIILFASKKGMPRDIQVDYLIDNGAKGPGDDEGPVNALANIVNGWLWCCEYTSALTRLGKAPGVLVSVFLPESTSHNALLQSPEGRLTLTDCKEAIPAGKLAKIYLGRMNDLCKTLAGEKVQSQIRIAAGHISEQLAGGGRVGISTCTHILMSEISLNVKTPMNPFFVVWTAGKGFQENLKEGDLLIWFGYMGMATPYEDYGKFIRETKVKFIASYIKDTNEANNAPDALFILEQNWVLGDTVVPLPFAPGAMAPISSIDQGLLFRMLDETVDMLNK